jgi:poly-gamma-glutamate capsule biosynthesis protein CapA/YwtB (metallophosphatase superfamily)
MLKLLTDHLKGAVSLARRPGVVKRALSRNLILFREPARVQGTPKVMQKKSVWAASAILVAIACALVYAIGWSRRTLDVAREEAAVSSILPPTGPIVISAVGDLVFGDAITGSDRDAEFETIVQIVRNANVAIANLEMSLVEDDTAAAARRGQRPRWTFGSAREASTLKTLGFDVVGQANNHATDYGMNSMSETRAILAASGLVSAGSGQDLDEARAPVLVGSGPRKIAVLAVAISAPSASMATRSRANSKGWPGINVLRYVADVTVDAQTYETLRRSKALPGHGGGSSDRLEVFGTTIRKGTTTSVNLIPDAGDVSEILAEVRRARTIAEAVILSVHSHEPSNDSDEPAEFFSTFARQAIDAGAALVVGHGPHRLRGVEVYQRGAILYSLGNFLYQPSEGHAHANDPYDLGIDMYSLAMGVSGSGAPTRFGPDSEEWWEGAVAVATLDAGVPRSLQIHPVDLGVETPSRRGLPRRPTRQRAVGTLERLARLSDRYRTAIRIQNGVGVVQIGQGPSPTEKPKE